VIAVLIEGVINLDKPAGISSARAVARVKRMLPRGTKIGHAGTLDPFATGVLLLLVGRATRQCENLMDAPKQYEATVKFGATTATDDPESPEEPFAKGEISPALREQIDAILPRFTGAIEQRPPVFSAVKVGGRRAYDLARKGHDVELAPRTVHVYGVELLSYDWPLATLRIDCGRGTYVRALARDLGAALGVGGYLTALRRTAIGPFSAADAVSLDELTVSNNVEQYVRLVPEIAAGLASRQSSPYNVPPGGGPSGSIGKDRSS
jgi:tRNA pseudouridine55 synthase